MALRGAGIDVDALARACGVDPERLDEPISAEAMDSLLGLAAASLPPWFGLTAGTEIRPELFGVVGFAAMSSPSFGAALHKLARYKRMMTQDELLLVPRRGHTVVQIRLTAGDAYKRQKLDFELAFLVAFGRRLTGREVRPLRVAIALERPPAAHRAHYDVLGCPVAFEQRANEIAFDDADLVAPLLSADTELAAIFGDRAERLRNEADDPRDAVSRVRAALRRSLRGALPTLAELAQQLGTSERQLQRRLHEDGTSFRRVVDEVRSELARAHLRDPALEVAEISFLLGFSHPNSFFRAFKRWTRSSPEVYRGTL